MKKLLFTLLWISFSAMLYSQVRDTTLSTKYERNIEGACVDFKKAMQCSYPNMSGTKEEYEKLCK